jgi:hypothetical protein
MLGDMTSSKVKQLRRSVPIYGYVNISSHEPVPNTGTEEEPRKYSETKRRALCLLGYKSKPRSRKQYRRMFRTPVEITDPEEIKAIERSKHVKE